LSVTNASSTVRRQGRPLKKDLEESGVTRRTSWEVPLLPASVIESCHRSSSPDHKATLKPSAPAVGLEVGEAGCEASTDAAKDTRAFVGTSVGSCSKMRSVLALLNKLSNQNEVSILEQLNNLRPISVEELGEIADLIFQQALKDPFRCDLYGQTIAKLNATFPQFKAPDKGGVTGSVALPRPVTLEAQVVRRCQTEFESVCLELQEFAVAIACPAQAGSQNVADADERHGRRKDRAMACMVVVGGLVQCKVLSVRVLGHVVVELLRLQGKGSGISSVASHVLPPEPYIECACELLSFVVGHLPREAEALAHILHHLAWLRDQCVKDGDGTASHVAAFAYSARTRFVMLDLLEGRPSRRTSVKASPRTRWSDGVASRWSALA